MLCCGRAALGTMRWSLHARAASASCSAECIPPWARCRWGRLQRRLLRSPRIARYKACARSFISARTALLVLSPSPGGSTWTWIFCQPGVVAVLGARSVLPAELREPEPLPGLVLILLPQSLAVSRSRCLAGLWSAPTGAAWYFPSFGNNFPSLSSNTGSS